MSVAYFSGLIFTVKTPGGTIVLECDPAALKDAQIEIDGEQVQLKLAGDDQPVTIGVDQKRGQLKITKAGFKVFDKTFEIAVGNNEQAIAVRFDPLPAAAPRSGSRETSDPAVRVASRWDALDPSGIPDAERIPELPQEVVAVAGSHRQRHWLYVAAIAFRPDGKQAVTSGQYGIRFWDLETFRQTGWLNGRDHQVSDVWSLVYTPDGRRLIAGHGAGYKFDITIIDCGDQGPAVAARLDLLRPGLKHGLELSPSGEFLAGYKENEKLASLWRLAGNGLKLVRSFDAISWASFDPLTLYSPVVFSPDGKQICVSGRADGTVQLHAFNAGEVTAGPVITGSSEERDDVPLAPLAQARFAPDGRLSIADGKGRMWFYDVSGETPRSVFGLDRTSTQFRFSSDGKTLLTYRGLTAQVTFDVWALGADGATHRFSNSPVPAGSVAMSSDEVTSFALSSDGRLAMTGHLNGAVRFWDLTGDTLREHVPVQPNPVWYDGPTNAGRIVHLAGRIGTQTESLDAVWWTPSGKGLKSEPLVPQVSRLSGTGECQPLAVSHDHTRLVTAEPGGKATLHEQRDGLWQPVHRVTTGARSVVSAALSRDGTRLAIGTGPPPGNAGATGLDLWDLSASRPTCLAHIDTNAIAVQLLFAANDRLLIARFGSPEINARVFRVTGQSLEELPVPELNGIPNMYDLAVSPDGTQLATAAHGRADLWSLSEAGAQHIRPIRANGNPQSISYAPDGRRLVLSTDDGGGRNFVTIHNLATGLNEHVIEFPGLIGTVRYLDDSRHILAVNHSGVLYILRP